MAEVKQGEMPEEPQEGKGEKLESISLEEFEKIKKALKDANKEAAERRKQLEAFEKAEEARKTAEMTELEKARAELEKLQRKALEFERKELQRKVALEVGLPDVLAYRIEGDTQEAMTEDAKALVEALKLQQKKQPPALPVNNPSDGKKGEVESERMQRMKRSANPFSNMTLAKERGGGVTEIKD